MAYEEKNEAIARYKSWHKSDYTQLLLDHLDEMRAQLVKEDEDKNDFVSKFQFSFVSIRNKAQRKVIRDLLKKVEWEI